VTKNFHTHMNFVTHRVVLPHVYIDHLIGSQYNGVGVRVGFVGGHGKVFGWYFAPFDGYRLCI